MKIATNPICVTVPAILIWKFQHALASTEKTKFIDKTNRANMKYACTKNQNLEIVYCNAVCDGSTPEAEKQVIFEGITDEDIATLTLEE